MSVKMTSSPPTPVDASVPVTEMRGSHRLLSTTLAAAGPRIVQYKQLHLALPPSSAQAALITFWVCGRVLPGGMDGDSAGIRSAYPLLGLG